MKAVITKSFHFSASYAKGERIIGKNYILEAAIDAVSADQEETFEKKVREGLIQRLESSDLSTHADLLQKAEIDDLGLLKIFWREIARLCPDHKLSALTLYRDTSTRTTLTDA